MSVRASRLLFILILQYMVWGWKQVHSTPKGVDYYHQSLINPYSCLSFVHVSDFYEWYFEWHKNLGNIQKLIILRSLACAQNSTCSNIFMQTAITANYYYQLSFSYNTFRRLREREINPSTTDCNTMKQ